MGIQTKVVSVVGVMIVIVILFATLLISQRVQDLSKDLTLEVAEEIARRNGLEVKRLLERALNEAKLIELAFWQLRANKVDRRVLDEILFENTVRDKSILGSWMLWEPNAYDNKDADYVNSQFHDHTGRVNSYWHWQGEQVVHETNIDWQTSSWYQNPKQRSKETLEDPYFYTVSGEELLLISGIQPIVHDGQFYGVVGVDIKLEKLRELVGSLSVLGAGYSVLIANNGMYVAHPEKQRIGKYAEDFASDHKQLLAANDIASMSIVAGFDEVLKAQAYNLLVKIELAATDSPWLLMISVPVEKITDPAIDIRNNILYTAIISGIITLILLALLTRKLLYPVLKMTEILKDQFDSDLEEIPRFDIDSHDEFGELAVSFNQMSAEINRSREKLEQLNSELSTFNDELEQRVILKTQKLLESEKMASLGRLVTGVSHELNTPVGVCVTALSYLQELIDNDSEATIDDIKESLNFLSDNINKVSSLINSLKLLSVNSSTEDKSSFSCKELIEASAANTCAQYDIQNITLDIKGDSFNIYSFPSSLSQVISHIVSNALVHGFDLGHAVIENPTITISIMNENNQVIIECSDNGRGMKKELKDKIFEAFSTQRLGTDGKGLGMNIVYNIVTQILKGTIECRSELGKGCYYRIQFPH